MVDRKRNFSPARTVAALITQQRRAGFSLFQGISRSPTVHARCLRCPCESSARASPPVLLTWERLGARTREVPSRGPLDLSEGARMLALFSRGEIRSAPLKIACTRRTEDAVAPSVRFGVRRYQKFTRSEPASPEHRSCVFSPSANS